MRINNNANTLHPLTASAPYLGQSKAHQNLSHARGDRGENLCEVTRRSSEYQATPAANETVPAQYGAGAAEHDAVPADHDAHPADHDVGPADYEPFAAPPNEFQKAFHDADVVNEFRRQAAQFGQRYGVTEQAVQRNQQAWIDENTGKGVMEGALWPDDAAIWKKIGDIKRQSFSVFMPGYAVGDRYAAILTMLIYPGMKLTIGYSDLHPVLPDEKIYAMEAFDIAAHALRKSGMDQDRIDQRLSVVRFDGAGPLNSISHSFNDPRHRKDFRTVLGEPSAICEPGTSSPDTHFFHISVTTLAMAKHWDDNGDPAHSAAEIRKLVYGLVERDSLAALDALVDKVIVETGLQKHSVFLWTTNKPFAIPVRDAASARQKEAFANPRMFELIRHALEEKGIPVARIGDGFKNTYVDRSEDRHPWEDRSIPDLCKFWEKSDLLKDRVNQWYFLDQLMKKSSTKAVIGVRSGALEPLGLLGHNVVYIEPKSMFTPERHASWQGRIPYNRLITEASMGYVDNDTEIELSNLRKDMIADNLRTKHLLGPGPGDEVNRSDSLSRAHGASQQNARRRDKIENNISHCTLAPAELKLLLRMVETGQPAHMLAQTA